MADLAASGGSTSRALPRSSARHCDLRIAEYPIPHACFRRHGPLAQSELPKDYSDSRSISRGEGTRIPPRRTDETGARPGEEQNTKGGAGGGRYSVTLRETETGSNGRSWVFDAGRRFSSSFVRCMRVMELFGVTEGRGSIGVIRCYRLNSVAGPSCQCVERVGHHHEPAAYRRGSSLIAAACLCASTMWCTAGKSQKADRREPGGQPCPKSPKSRLRSLGVPAP